MDDQNKCQWLFYVCEEDADDDDNVDDNAAAVNAVNKWTLHLLSNATPTPKCVVDGDNNCPVGEEEEEKGSKWRGEWAEGR